MITETEPILECQRAVDIDVVDVITSAEFLHRYIKKNRPLVMRRMTSGWPALKRWSFDFFRDLDSQSTVHLEHGNVLQGRTEFRKETFANYIRRLVDEDDSENMAYLSVFKIFDEFPSLKNDVNFSLIDQHKLKSSTVGWIGPAGTVTGYHIDWGDNLLAQISGRKRICIAPPESTPNMYVSPKFDQGTTISMVNLESIDVDKFPLFSKVEQTEFILHPGEMLFIPRGWWHDVKSLDRSISVSNMTYDAKGILFDAAPQRLKQLAHNIGLWKCDCTCHVRHNGKWVRK